MRGRRSGRGRGRSQNQDSSNFGPSGYGFQIRQKESAFQYDAATHALISDVHRVMSDGRSFTLELFRADAEKLLQRGLAPVLEFYLKGDFGDCMEGLVGRYTKPWSPLSIAEILRNHSASFPQIASKAKKLGTMLAKLITTMDSDPRRDAEIALKIMCCVREALSMFPKERPHYMAHMPQMPFTEVMDICRASRKEMKKVWSNCIVFVQRPMPTSPHTRLHSWQPQPQPQRSPSQPVKFTPSDFMLPTAPPLPPMKPSEDTPTDAFFLGLQTESHSAKGLVAEALEIDPKMALSPASLLAMQGQVTARYHAF